MLALCCRSALRAQQASSGTVLPITTFFLATSHSVRPFSVLARSSDIHNNQARPNLPQSQFQPTTTTTTLTPLQSTFPQTGQAQCRTFSASATLAAKRDTYNPSRRVQKRRHGFLARLRSRAGRKILMRRRAKGRKALSW